MFSTKKLLKYNEVKRIVKFNIKKKCYGIGSFH